MDTSSIPSHWLIAKSSFLGEKSKKEEANVSRVVEPGEIFGPDEVDGGAAVVEEQPAKEHQWDEERRSKSQRHVN